VVARVRVLTVVLALSQSAETFASFTEFTTHVDALCYYLESSIWQSQTHALVQLLLSGANETAARLADFASDAARHHAVAVGMAEEISSRHAALALQLAGTEDRVSGVVDVLDRVGTYAAVAVHLQGYVVSHILVLQVRGEVEASSRCGGR
jgi:hypothetical protein